MTSHSDRRQQVKLALPLAVFELGKIRDSIKRLSLRNGRKLKLPKPQLKVDFG